MITFQEILTRIFQREGGYVNIREDKGGETYKGISRNNFPQWEGWQTIDKHKQRANEDILNEVLSHDVLLHKQVEEFYREEIWTKSKTSLLPEHLRVYFFDMVVHHGQSSATIMLQRCINLTTEDFVTVDGILGPITANASKPVKLDHLRVFRIQYIAEIIEKDQSQTKFLTGWYQRAIG